MMKRCFAILMLFCLLHGLVSCRAVPSPHGEIADDPIGIVLQTQYPVYADDADEIWYTIGNHSDDVAEFGTEWALEMLDGETWMTLPLKNDVWTALLHTLPAGSRMSCSVRLSQVNAEIKDGTYRIVRMINDVPYAAEFQIGDSAYGKDTPHGFSVLDASFTDFSIVSDGTRAAAFFECLLLGTPSQLRVVNEANGIKTVHDLTYDTFLGVPRFAYSVLADGAVTTTYYSFLSLSNNGLYLTNLRGDPMDACHFPADALFAGENGAYLLETLERYIENRQAAVTSGAIFHAPDGMRYIALYDDPLEFGVSIMYPNGGSSGSISTLAKMYGMKKITSVLWQDNTVALLICEPSHTDQMKGYVFYDTAVSEVKSYTYSGYAPKITDEGILIPE